MRDDFTKRVIDDLARRSGYKCSNPNCRSPTAGPDGGNGTASIGVASHITAAAPGGERYDATISSEERSSIDNGIWLCQTCSRLIDTDVLSHPVELLRGWKKVGEARAYLELRGFDVIPTRNFKKLETKIPLLVAEMRADIHSKPFTREFIALSKRVTHMGSERPYFRYFFEDHDELLGKLKVCENYGAIIDKKFNSVGRWEFTEGFVEFLEGTQNE